MSVNVYDPINDELIPVAGATLYADVGVGSIIAFAGKEINLPEGYLAFNGQTVKRNDYPDLWAFAVANEQVGVDKFFSQGDGATTFTLADLRETSLKGYGETSRSVGAHVKSGGLGIGEFVDDRVQDHAHKLYSNPNTGDLTGHSWFSTDNGGNANFKNNPLLTSSMILGRSGATTEVKAVGVVWAVKARMTGLPIDLKAEVDKYILNQINENLGANLFEDYAGTTAWFRYGTKVVARALKASSSGIVNDITPMLNLFGITTGYYSLLVTFVNRSSTMNSIWQYIISRNSSGSFVIPMFQTNSAEAQERKPTPSSPTATSLTLTTVNEQPAIMATFEPMAYY